jgi:hypothetical protein
MEVAEVFKQTHLKGVETNRLNHQGQGLALINLIKVIRLQQEMYKASTIL